VPTRAQNAPGVSDKEILIGSCAALEGPSGVSGRQTVIGAKAYLPWPMPGVAYTAPSLKLICSDDNYDPDKTQVCFDRLMAEKVFALGFFVGTPAVVKYVPIAEANKIPLVGLFPGAQVLYTLLRHWVINVRPSYQDETRAQVTGLWNALNFHKIGSKVAMEGCGIAAAGASGACTPARILTLSRSCFGLLEGVVGGADQRAGFHMLEAHGFAEDFEFGELVGVNVAHDGQMIFGGLQVLP
jgi:hypothetical protein